MAISAYLGVHGSANYHFYVDETMHTQMAEGKTFQEAMQFSLFETHPPLGNIIRYFWLKINDTLWFGRFLSLLFALPLIPLYYLIGKKISGELTGLICATLITFNHICIVQSYIIRNYSMFFFFLSAGFYFYLLWRDERENLKLLTAYSFFTLLACLVHFSGLLAVSTIGLYELLAYYSEKKSLKAYIRWGIANIPSVAASFVILYIWHDTLSTITVQVSKKFPVLPLHDILITILLYPVLIIKSLFISPSFIYLLALVIPLSLARKNPVLGRLLLLPCLAFLILEPIFMLGYYPYTGDRHNLWLLPFLLIPVACACADISLWLTKSLRMAAVSVFLCAILFYNPAMRFGDPGEYKVTEEQWNNIFHYLDSQDDKTLLISGRNDAIVTIPPEANIYRYFSDKKYDISPQSSLIPYYNTKLLLDKEYFTYTNSMLAILQDAAKNHLLDRYNKFIIFNAFPSVTSITGDLTMCPSLDKKLVSFPVTEPGHVFTSKEEMQEYDIIFIELSKQALMDEIISPTGKARSCLYSNPYLTFSK